MSGISDFGMSAVVVLLFMVRRAVSETTQVMLINGAALHVFERGDGESVVLVHGSSSDYRTWEAQLDDLAAVGHALETHVARFAEGARRPCAAGCSPPR